MRPKLFAKNEFMDNALFFNDMSILCHSEAFGFSSQKDNNH